MVLRIGRSRLVYSLGDSGSTSAAEEDSFVARFTRDVCCERVCALIQRLQQPRQSGGLTSAESSALAVRLASLRVQTLIAEYHSMKY